MSLALPAALWGLLLLPIVVLLRLLARRPRAMVVPSLIPWREAASASLSDRRPSVRLDAQLVLQLLAVSAAVLALAGPRLETRVSGAREVVVGVYSHVLRHWQFWFFRGLVDTGHMVFYVSTTALFLFLTVRVVESRKWR